ncbi:hypothetical protein CH276_15780 [Rhodococcus sp. 06-470-2]|uniref:AAA family ATPase n=1 Tax=unclassified Rhodococcus (in: high G+C Gram-positive bacteria) TaxID=192944 RepID=UPI000B9B0327|nr:MULTISPECIES: AAA family ATPase [unclassified Rhodococcus (in: high G+C Gram-positive bacteria)]OZC60801.1 hypothetical protein CH276_15780 [Rhodococcus sp. 06-470-2]OZE64154.1 hypothetical protein CH265_10420 [Rhodococcus sp. 05-2221-1B]
MTYIDSYFRNPVKTHVLANLLTDAREFPLILGIFGPPGEGKTYQVNAIFSELGIHEQLVSPGELESENAGAPAQLLRREYMKASDRTCNGQPTALVIHDIDTVLGNWGELVQYTVNRQIVYGQLMAFCDFPNEVNGHRTTRVPIVITGNNPSILYGPMMRPGRTRLLQWKPDTLMRFQIIASIFPQVEQETLHAIVTKYPNKPVAFWADVRSAALESRVQAAIDSIGETRVIELLKSGHRIQVDEEVNDPDLIGRIAHRFAGTDIRSDDYLAVGSGCEGSRGNG